MSSWNALKLQIRNVLHVSLLCVSVSVCAQAMPRTDSIDAMSGAPLINNYDSKTYKAHSQNWISVQDQRGVLYFGNSSGLIEFDGQRWQSISTKGNPMMRALAIASDQTIFYGSIGDLGYLAADKKGKVEAISLLEKIPENERNFNDVWQIEATSHGVYFLTRSRIFRFFQGQISVLSGKFASSQAMVMNDHLLYVDSELGLSMIAAGKIIPLPDFAQVGNGKRVVLSYFGTHQVLAARASGDFLRLDFSPLWNAAQKSYQSLSGNQSTPLVHKFVTEIDHLTDTDNLFLYKMIPVGEHLFAISTIKGGIILLNRQGKVHAAITRNAGLIDNTVASVMLDRANNLWASTNSGISHIELSLPQTVYTNRNGIDGISISSIAHRGEFYVGTYQNVLRKLPFHYQQKQDAPQFVVIPNSPSEIWQFKEIAGDLMIASSRGLFRLVDNQTQRIAGSGSDGYAIGSSPRWPDYLFMGKMGGLEIFKRENGQWKLFSQVPQIHENIRRITADASGDLWLSTEVQGLLRLHFVGDDPSQVRIHRIGIKHGLPQLIGNRAKFIDDTLFSITSKGLYSAKIAPWSDASDQTQFSPDARFGKQFSDGSMNVSDLNSDQHGGYLLQTSEGVQLLEKGHDGTFLNKNQAFRGLITSDESLYVHPDGSIWLPGENLYRVQTQTEKDYTQSFSAMIRRVAANTTESIFEGSFGKQASSIQDASTVFHLTQTAQDIPQLSYQQNALMFEFAADFYEKPGSTQFQYRLEGFDQHWSEWTRISAKEYTNIPEGKYRFQVRAKNIYGKLAEEATYQFTILPPWYRTYWAYALWFILVGATILGGMQLYTIRLRKNKKRLEHEVIERTREAILQKDAADQARHKIALLAEMGKQITSSLEIHAIEKSLYTYVQDLIPSNTFGIGIVDWEHRVIRFDYVIENGKPIHSYQRSLDASDQPATQCVLSAKELLVNNLTLDTRELDSFISLEFDTSQIKQDDGKSTPMPRSAIYVPMMLNNRVMGVIAVQNDVSNSYHENDVTILRSLGSYAAVAFDNANSYQRLQLTQSKLVEQEKLAALGSLVAGIAHELNTPIGNSLLTASSLDELSAQLVQDIQSGSIRRSRLENFSTQAKAACTLLMRNLENAANLITSFKQIAVDQTSDKRRVFNLQTVTTEVASTLGGRIRRDLHQLKIQIPADIEMDSYPGPYGQVISNMIINALLHAFDENKSGEIRIIASQLNASHVRIQIKDNGKGISEDNLNRIFDPFFTTRMGQGGSGLGLHISYNIVTAILGGSIKVKSRVSKGTIFELILPLCAPEANVDTKPENTAATDHSIKP